MSGVHGHVEFRVAEADLEPRLFPLRLMTAERVLDPL
jgi:hypothetical protein